MATEVGNNAVHTVARASRSPVYRAFGVGLDPPELAKRLDRLRQQSPAEFLLLIDVANRVLFVDHLRFEVGWHLETPRRDEGDYVRLDYNLDALEIYLLCTCIDALGGANGPQLRFPDWLRQNRHSVEKVLSDNGIESAERYMEVTQGFYKAYRDSKPGPSKRFAQVFRELPTFMKEYMAEGIVVIDGGLGSVEFRNRVQRWWERSVEDRVRWIASHYLWSRRRGVYTHRTKIEKGLRSGVFRRITERGALTDDETSWSSTSFTSGSDPDAVRLTVASKTSVDEGFLLRAIVALRALTGVLGYEAFDDYLQDFFSYYDTVAAAYSVLHEMQGNREYLDFLSAPGASGREGDFGSYPLPGLSTTATTRLVEEFIEPLQTLHRFLRSYIEQSHEVNKRVLRFNASHQAKVAKWSRWRSEVADFCQEPGFAQRLDSVRWYGSTICLSVRRALHAGEILGSWPSWSVVWGQLRRNLNALPRCPLHPQYPHVRTLVHGVANDILDVDQTGVIMRSHRTLVERRVSAGVFKDWWATLLANGVISVASPPRTEHSRVVAAVLAASLPHKVRYVAGELIRAAG